MRNVLKWLKRLRLALFMTSASLAGLTGLTYIFVVLGASGNYLEPDFADGLVGLAALPMIFGIVLFIVSTSGALVSGSKFVNEQLGQGEKSHNPIWGALFWFVPIYGLYKSYVMGRSIERKTNSSSNVTAQVFSSLILGWLISAFTDASTRDVDSPNWIFALVLGQSLVIVVWTYIGFVIHKFINELEGLQKLSDLGVSHPTHVVRDSVSAGALGARQKFCTKCGIERLGASNFCGSCGAEFLGS